MINSNVLVKLIDFKDKQTNKNSQDFQAKKNQITYKVRRKINCHQSSKTQYTKQGNNGVALKKKTQGKKV